MIFVLAFIVIVGAIAQRTTGVGFAMIVSPFTVILLSAYDAVVVTSVLAAGASALVLRQLWRRVQWKTVLRLLPTSLLGTLGGTVLAESFSNDVMSIAAGAALVVALLVSMVVARRGHVVAGNSPIYLSGFAAGITTALAGIGGPAMSVYAVLSRWDPRLFAATMQPYFLFMSLTVIVARLVGSGGRLPALGPGEWAILVVATLVGLLLGTRIERHISATWARSAVIALALVGGVLAIGDGILGILVAG